jgi:hypothetical protein
MSEPFNLIQTLRRSGIRLRLSHCEVCQGSARN